jgi:hypothetical protein
MVVAAAMEAASIAFAARTLPIEHLDFSLLIASLALSPSWISASPMRRSRDFPGSERQAIG